MESDLENDSLVTRHLCHSDSTSVALLPCASAILNSNSIDLHSECLYGNSTIDVRCTAWRYEMDISLLECIVVEYAATGDRSAIRFSSRLDVGD
ncbi:hypothetical protein D3C85_1458800 [compost metagenome]